MLWVHRPGLIRSEAKKRGIEAARFVENGRSLDVVRRRQVSRRNARAQNLLVGE